MITDYDGTDVFDADGDKLGHVERTYIDKIGQTKFVELKMGTLFAKHRLVPLDDAQTESDGLHIPFSKAEVEGSPDVSGIGDGIDSSVMERVEAYYDGAESNESRNGPAAQEIESADSDEEEDSLSVGDRIAQKVDAVENKLPGGSDTEEADDAAANGDPTAVRDLGDRVEIPIVEEEIVKRPVVKEVVQVRKTPTSESQVVAGDVRREDVEVVQNESSGESLGDRVASVFDRVKAKVSDHGESEDDAPAD